MPEMGDIDSMTLRRSKRRSPKSQKVRENEEQAKVVLGKRAVKSGIMAATLFSMMCLTTVSSLPATFSPPKTRFSKAVAHVSVSK